MQHDRAAGSVACMVQQQQAPAMAHKPASLVSCNEYHEESLFSCNPFWLIPDLVLCFLVYTQHWRVLVLLVQATSAYSVKVQGWLKEEALEWGSKIDVDLAAKEKDTQTVKQERQRDLIALKVCSLYHPSYTSTIKVWYFKVCMPVN